MSRSISIIALLLLASCGGGTTSETTKGGVLVRASTAGFQLDPNGYTVNAEGAGSAPLPINGSLKFTDLPAGDHLVGLAGVATNCHTPDSSLTATVVPAATDTVTFIVACDTTYGRLRVRTTSGGLQLDANGYSFSLNGVGSTPIGSTCSTCTTPPWTLSSGVRPWQS